jgi:geranylgeranyl diphosphate synthase, type II
MNYIEHEIKRLNIENKIKKYLFFKSAKKHSLEWGMSHITFAPCKRLRPLLILEANLAYGSIDEDCYVLCAALESIHTYSLVHDDLPCMDNDDLRRGVKTLHKIKNEAYALLTGDALLTNGFGILSGYKKIQHLPCIIKLFNEKTGYKRMIYGQILDIEGENKKLNINQMNEINLNKTSSLFELSLMLGAINANANSKQVKIMEDMGKSLGLLFQLKDDLLDITGDEKIMGKKKGSDEKNKKASIPLIIGLEKSQKMLEDYKKKTIDLVKKIPGNNDFFYKLIDFIIERKK